MVRPRSGGLPIMYICTKDLSRIICAIPCFVLLASRLYCALCLWVVFYLVPLAFDILVMTGEFWGPF